MIMKEFFLLGGGGGGGGGGNTRFSRVQKEKNALKSRKVIF